MHISAFSFFSNYFEHVASCSEKNIACVWTCMLKRMAIAPVMLTWFNMQYSFAACYLFFFFWHSWEHLCMKKQLQKKTLVSRAQSCICIIMWCFFCNSSWCNDSCNSNCFFNCCNVLSNDKFFVVCPFTRNK